MDIRARTLGALAAEQPSASRVFLRHKLDFCCGGKRTLGEACAQAGLDAEAIARELADEADRRDDDVLWTTRTPAELADHIEGHYHRALERDMPPLIQAARKVERVHADKPGVPAGLADLLTEFWDEMIAHMMKEETVLFPLIRGGARGPGLAMPIGVMQREHDEHGEHLAAIHALTDDLEPPPHACATWRALYAGLAQIESDLMLHIHLENHILFARALQPA